MMMTKEEAAETILELHGNHLELCRNCNGTGDNGWCIGCVGSGRAVKDKYAEACRVLTRLKHDPRGSG